MHYVKYEKKGFTLVEILVAIAILGLLSAIAFPNFMNSKQRAARNACLANVRQLSAALEVAAIERNIDTANLTEAEIEAIVLPDYIKRMPSCAYGDYATDADGNVSCTFHGSP